MQRVYAILAKWNEDGTGGHLYFPIKKDDADNYAGMPQFFGGEVKDGETALQAVKREMCEESNNKLILGDGGTYVVFDNDVGHNRYAFFVATRYSDRGKNFLGPLDNNNEMKAIDEFEFKVGGASNVGDVLKKLGIKPTEKFLQSETCKAFDQALAACQQPRHAYAVLLDNDGHLYFPIERVGQEYGGMPQFFGGPKISGESNRDTIARLMSEQSDGKLTLLHRGLELVCSDLRAQFFVAEHYSGQHFLGPLKNSKMQSIERFKTEWNAGQNVKDLLRRLGIVPTQAFSESAAYMAFDAIIEWCEDDGEG